MRQPGLLAISIAAALCTLATVGQSQRAPETASTRAANAWMLTPTPYLEWNKDISPSLRAQRDRFWDAAAPQQRPLTLPNSDMAVPSGGTFDRTQPEIQYVPNRVILTGTFTKYRSVLSASEMSLYTEVTLHVDTVYDDQSGSGHPFANKDITLLLSGGTVTLRSGSSLTHNTPPREFSLQPDRRYLVVLSYHAAEDFYLVYDNWDISSGAARANTYRTRYYAKAGRSLLEGVAVRQLGTALQRELYGFK
jgi:hypothetical protein